MMQNTNPSLTHSNSANSAQLIQTKKNVTHTIQSNPLKVTQLYPIQPYLTIINQTKPNPSQYNSTQLHSTQPKPTITTQSNPT